MAIAKELEDIPDEIRYMLSKPFEYARAGENVPAEFIELRAPTPKHADHCAAMTQAFLRSVRDAASDAGDQVVSDEVKDDAEDSEMTPRQLMQGIGAASNVDLAEIMAVGRRLFLSNGIALIDGETQLKPAHIERMSFADFNAMLGMYVLDFLAASSLDPTDAQSKKGSQT